MSYQVRPYSFTVSGGQKNVSISSSTALTLSDTGTTVAIVTAVGGQAYFTYDGVAPTSSSYNGTLSTGASIELQGIDVIAKFLIIGTTMSVAYFK
jgi:hypothetical protein